MISITAAARLLSLDPSRIRLLCRQGRIAGAQKIGRDWMLPDRPKIMPGRPVGRPRSEPQRDPARD